MRLQKVFKESYVKTLRDRLRANISTDHYALEEFPYEQNMVRSLSGVYHPEDLSSKMNPNDDLASAKALYEAYEKIPPVVASSDTFWVYLTHVDLFHYMRQRWKKVMIGEADNTYIEAHWIANGSNYGSSSLQDLWWAVHGTIDKERGDKRKYELTDFLFSNIHFRELVTTKLFRHKEAVIGILEFLTENKEVCNIYTKRRFRYIMKYFNQLGSTKLLPYLDRDFFKSELCKQKRYILNYTKEDIE